MILNFVAEWDRGDRRATWSGTTFALYNALQKFFEVRDIDVSMHQKTKFDNRMDKIRRLLNINKVDDFGMRANEAAWKYVKYIESQDKNRDPQIYFQFAEIAKDSSRRKTYIFQDLSVDFLCRQYNASPETFAMGNFRGTTIDVMKKRRKIQNEYYKNCAGIFTLSHWMHDDLIDRLGINSTKVHHVGGGINVNPDDIDDSNKEGNKILFVGRDFKRKGGDLVVEAFKILRQQQSNVQLYIAGPETNPLSSYEEGIFFLGALNREQMTETYNKCDVFCMPSHFEPYGLVFIEALSYGLPCIGRNCQEMPYFIKDGETGALINNDNPAILAKKMLLCLQNNQIKQSVLDNRSFYLEEYNWDNVARRIYQVICADLNISPNK